MIILTGNKPLKGFFQEETLVIYEKFIRLLSTELWRNYNVSKPRKQKTKDVFFLQKKKKKEKKIKSDNSFPTFELLKALNPIHVEITRKKYLLINSMTKSSSYDCEQKAGLCSTLAKLGRILIQLLPQFFRKLPLSFRK